MFHTPLLFILNISKQGRVVDDIFPKEKPTIRFGFKCSILKRFIVHLSLHGCHLTCRYTLQKAQFLLRFLHINQLL
jgi:hypothetical protein